MDVPALRRALLAWFSRAKRPLPWRRTRDPYAIWVSEAMLQQTTVATVIPYYERFLARFPSVASLAASKEDDVLALWSGLGYYSRARNLREAALQVVANHAGRFPQDVETAMSLKGVGRYTASAVTSIAYGTKAAVVDGNVRRVLARLFAIRGLTDARAQELAQQLLSTRSSGAWNEAVMELGATVCRPRSPLCDGCPVATYCQGRDRPEHWSAGKPRPSSIELDVDMALVERAGRVLLVRNPAHGLMRGLLQLPHCGLPGSANRSLRRTYQGVLAIDACASATFRHTVTRHRIRAAVFRARLLRSGVPDGAAFHSLKDIRALPLGGLTRKALRAAGFDEF